MHLCSDWMLDVGLFIFNFFPIGVYGNSPSACFIASDGHSLRLYQAIIEAKKLLSELSNPDISVRMSLAFTSMCKIGLC